MPGDQAQRDNPYEPRQHFSLNISLRPMTRKKSLALDEQLHPHLALVALAGVGAFLFAAKPYSGRARR